MNFKEDVFAITARIPKGKVATYGQLAALLERPGSARAVGNALHQNRDPIKVPCHRVVNRNGELAVHFGMGGVSVQKARLTFEDVEVMNGRVDLEKYQWRPDKS